MSRIASLGLGGIAALRMSWISGRISSRSGKCRVSGSTVVTTASCRQAKAGEIQLQEDDDLGGDSKELVVIDFKNGKGENTNCEINTLGNVQATVMAFSEDDSGVLEQVNVDTKLEVKPSSEDLDCGTGLHTDTESSLNGGLAGNNRDGQLTQSATSTVTS